MDGQDIPNHAPWSHWDEEEARNQPMPHRYKVDFQYGVQNPVLASIEVEASSAYMAKLLATEKYERKVTEDYRRRKLQVVAVWRLVSPDEDIPF